MSHKRDRKSCRKHREKYCREFVSKLGPVRYVKADAAPDGDGSLARPWNSLQQAQDNSLEWNVLKVLYSAEGRLESENFVLERNQEIHGCGENPFRKPNGKVAVFWSKIVCKGENNRITNVLIFGEIDFSDAGNITIDNVGTPWIPVINATNKSPGKVVIRNTAAHSFVGAGCLNITDTEEICVVMDNCIGIGILLDVVRLKCRITNCVVEGISLEDEYTLIIKCVRDSEIVMIDNSFAIIGETIFGETRVIRGEEKTVKSYISGNSIVLNLTLRGSGKHMLKNNMIESSAGWRMMGGGGGVMDVEMYGNNMRCGPTYLVVGETFKQLTVKGEHNCFATGPISIDTIDVIGNAFIDFGGGPLGSKGYNSFQVPPDVCLGKSSQLYAHHCWWGSESGPDLNKVTVGDDSKFEYSFWLTSDPCKDKSE